MTFDRINFTSTCPCLIIYLAVQISPATVWKRSLFGRGACLTCLCFLRFGPRRRLCLFMCQHFALCKLMGPRLGRLGVIVRWGLSPLFVCNLSIHWVFIKQPWPSREIHFRHCRACWKPACKVGSWAWAVVATCLKGGDTKWADLHYKRCSFVGGTNSCSHVVNGTSFNGCVIHGRAALRPLLPKKRNALRVQTHVNWAVLNASRCHLDTGKDSDATAFPTTGGLMLWTSCYRNLFKPQCTQINMI